VPSDLNSANNVLFVVYDFPPEGARGTKRSIKFIRYLPQNHWNPVVLTVRNPNYIFHDRSLFAELPQDLVVYRAWTPESLFHRKGPGHTEACDPGAEVKQATPPTWLRRAALSVYKGVGKFARIPDSRLLWLPFAMIKGFRAIRHNRCRVIYTSGPTHTNHLVGALLSRLTRRPLVMDFRDAWVSDPAARRGNGWTMKANSFLEQLCIRRARVVVCTTDGIRNDFESRYPESRGKCVTIPNGFDQSEFVQGTEPEDPSRRSVLKIVHAGTLGGERSPREFLAALGSLLEENPDLIGQLEVTFVGQNSPFLDGCVIEDYVEKYGCGLLVKITGFVSRDASLDYIRQADLLLLIIGRVPKEGAFVYGISGKIYDYAAAGMPVLTISETGSTAELARRLNLGPVLNPDDIQGIKSAIVSLVALHKCGGIPYSPDLELLKSFEFSSLTAKLAQCFHTTSSKT